MPEEEQKEFRLITLGLSRVRILSNPSKNPLVDEFKEKFAYLIDLCDSIQKTIKDDESLSPHEKSERLRTWAEAMSLAESACEKAVKAATT